MEVYGETGAPHGDMLVTGILRERLPHVRIQLLESLDWWISWCPGLYQFKQTFFNSLIVSKKSSGGGVQYVGSVTSTGVWKYFLCIKTEGLLMGLESILPNSVPSFIWNICAR